ncbi:hydroxymethylglutaryl-CoA reductase, degradative [Lactococcus nasutitermitis]|uniref:3-hydroxy-3-methylglutaryl coenzyme A reductase n=1 Tax=Lactococcus nasutitermitis TaxID=1652957 RepID=A0ABV9JFM9_9LACT|nr:hydroxymethylglutaryl-CoA reductase, degradative [Lactococcus nasutitermitis]
MDKKFYQMSTDERIEILDASQETQEILKQMSLDKDIANNLIENQISEIELPLGVAQNFIVNHHSYQVPMATEEPSVIAAASNGAKIAGDFKAVVEQRLMRGQIVFYEVKQSSDIIEKIQESHTEILRKAENVYPSIITRGGGLREVSTRNFSKEKFLSVDFKIDVKDAMGANIVNSILEGISELFREWFPEENILFSILSNYATESLVTAQCTIPVEHLSKIGNGREVAEKIVQASRFSKIDPYRAATHNKGIMNGINAVVLATGNDTRAIASGIHAFAAQKGSYQGLGKWELKENELYGELTVPLPVATVGGGIKILPKAQAALEILHVNKAEELAELIAAVGLAQNLAALRALVSEGIQRGHMSLQSRSLAMAVGAEADEIAILSAQLRQDKIMNQQIAEELLKKIRNKKAH